jgi:hypothetical protein
MLIAKAYATIALGLSGAQIYSQGLGRQVDELDSHYSGASVESEQARWMAVDVLDMSTDGGDAIGYFRDDGTLFLANVRLFGEGGRSEFVFLLDRGIPILVRERSFEYNRPYYWDLEVARQNDDDQVFDPEKTVVMERSVYYDGNEILIVQPAQYGDEHGLVNLDVLLGLFEEIKVLFDEAAQVQELVDPGERWVVDLFRSPGPPVMADTGLCGVVLNEASSAEEVLGTATDRGLHESEYFPLPHANYRCNDTSAYATFGLHYGAGTDEYAEMQLSVTRPDTLYGTLSTRNCKSSSGIFLGMKEEQVLALFGNKGLSGAAKNRNRLLRYRMDGVDHSGFLARYGYPSYYMTFEFGQEGLVEYRFGFEYP